MAGGARLGQPDVVGELRDAALSPRERGHEAESRGIGQAGQEVVWLGGHPLHCMAMHIIVGALTASPGV
jgi:hypothetical protein